MTATTPIKTSSRAGRFKKKLVSQNELVLEAPIVRDKLAPFQELFASGKISESEFTAAYILVYLSHRFPGSWLGSGTLIKTPGVSWRELPFQFEANIIRRLENVSSLMDIFSFALKSTPKTVNRAILEWNAGIYGLVHMFGIPSAAKVLQQQKSGRRCVTTICDERISDYILGERDALSFTMHDLIHADHFYRNNICYEGQLGFYGLLDRTLPYFDLSNEKFAAEFEYVIADMNAYAVHLMKCLKSAMIHYFSEDYFRGWLLELNPPVALYALNTPAYVPEQMDAEILSWLNVFKNTTPTSD